ncbi:MAG: FHA domain-containing protein, partial [Verrucomicrobiales bacterium]
MPKLTIHHQGAQDIDHELTGDLITVGRRTGNDIVISDSFMSGKHAELHRQKDGSYELVDLGSHNGTFVNDKRIEKIIVAADDQIRFGVLNATISMDENAATSARPPQPSAAVVKTTSAPPSLPNAPTMTMRKIAPKPAENKSKGSKESKGIPAPPSPVAKPVIAAPTPSAASATAKDSKPEPP